jgi:diguanylate cyclase (GGDEF)-like protein
VRLAGAQTTSGQGQLVAASSRSASRARSAGGIARRCRLAQQRLARPPSSFGRTGGCVHVIAVSTTADGGWPAAGSAATPRLPRDQGSVPIVTTGGEDALRRQDAQRRRHERAGAAYPLLDGQCHRRAGDCGRDAHHDRIAALVAELGPRLAAAKAVHDAEQRAVLDHLTGLRNRGEFQRVLESYRAQQHPPAASLVYVDLDHFKRLNDTLGHAAGDAALKHIARVLEEAVRDGDLVARIGGEEFAVWLPHAQLAEGWEVAERIRDSVADTMWQWSGTAYPLTTSCGVATYPEPIADILNLPAAADAALYRAKELGRNRVEKASRSD